MIGPQTRAAVEGLHPGVTYDVSVRACRDAVDGVVCSGWTEPVSFDTVSIVPEVPTNFLVGAPGFDILPISWSRSGPIPTVNFRLTVSGPLPGGGWVRRVDSIDPTFRDLGWSGLASRR